MEVKARADLDIFPKLAAYLDPHLVIPVLSSFYPGLGIYSEAELHKTILSLARRTWLVDLAGDYHHKLAGADAPLPEDLQRKKDQSMDEWRRLTDACGPLLHDIVGIDEVTALLRELGEAQNFTYVYLKETYGITSENVEALYDCAKFRYESGEYAVAVDYLHYYRLLVATYPPDVVASLGGEGRTSDRTMQALWGRFGAEILVELSEDASRDLQVLLGAIRQSRQSDLQVMQQRAWLLHWSLFVFASSPDGKDRLIEFFMTDGGDKNRDKISNLNVIVLTCPWLLRYLIACLLMNKKRQSQLKNLLRNLSPADISELNDPMIDFLYKVLGTFDFEGAQQKLADCASVIATDYFLSGMMSAEEFLAAARRFVFEVYCRVHQKIDVKQLAAQLHMEPEESEKWIVELIRSAQIDARLDTKTSSLQMMQPDTTLYQQIHESTRDLIGVTRNLMEAMEGLGASAEAASNAAAVAAAVAAATGSSSSSGNSSRGAGSGGGGGGGGRGGRGGHRD